MYAHPLYVWVGEGVVGTVKVGKKRRYLGRGGVRGPHGVPRPWPAPTFNKGGRSHCWQRSGRVFKPVSEF